MSVQFAVTCDFRDFSDLIITVFLEEPLAAPGSPNYIGSMKIPICEAIGFLGAKG